jgi:hypothetical protein
MDMTRGTHRERLFAANATVQEAAAALNTGEQWLELLTTAASFHRYSVDNQLLLAAQGASWPVATFDTWTRVLASEGRPCQIQAGERPLGLYAPIHSHGREVDGATGLPTAPAVVARKVVPVFHMGQLVAPPALSHEPKAAASAQGLPEVWEAVANQIYALGFTLQRAARIDGPESSLGLTSFVERSVIVRDELPPASAIKAAIHQLAHASMHISVPSESGVRRTTVEVEAESVASVVCSAIGIDADQVRLADVAACAGRDPAGVAKRARDVLRTAGTIVTGIETDLNVDLRPNPLVRALASMPRDAVAFAPAGWRGTPGTSDEIIFEQLGSGTLDWDRLAALLAMEEPYGRSRGLGGKPGSQAIALAAAGASVDASVAVLRSQGLDHRQISTHLTVTLVDSLGLPGPLYHPDDVARALAAETPPVRTSEPTHDAGDRRVDRGQELIDGWSARATATPGVQDRRMHGPMTNDQIGRQLG